MSTTRTMVINDLHIPWHCEKSLNLVLNIFEDRKLDRLIINGDMLDMYCVNMHGPKSPLIETTLQDELDAGANFIKKLRERFPRKEIVLCAGNHLVRLNRFILKHAKPFWNVLTVEKHLELERHSIEFYPYQAPCRLEDTNCYVVHSPPSYGQNGARTSLLKKLDRTFIYGCTHRQDSAFMTGASGEVHAAYFNGWLGSVDATPEHKEIFSYAKGHQSWQQCFCIVTIVDHTEFHVNQYTIKNHKAVVDGYLYDAN